MTSPSVVVFDVNETLSDMAPMAQRFAEVGTPELLAKVWFASLLRDGFALTATGASERFSVIGAGALRSVLSGATLTMDMDSAIQHVMDGFSSLELHPDVPDGIRALATNGARLFTLTNGSVQVADRLFSAAGISRHFERLLSVDDARIWKPAPGAYAYAVRTCAADPADMILVAVHPWDIDGAARAGLRTCWINRNNDAYPTYFRPPEITVGALPELADYVT